jgi:hypothetical protein
MSDMSGKTSLHFRDFELLDRKRILELLNSLFTGTDNSARYCPRRGCGSVFMFSGSRIFKKLDPDPGSSSVYSVIFISY